MTKRLLDHLLAEDVLQLREGLRRAEDVEARVEAPPAEAAPSPVEPAESDTQPTIAATRRANRAGRRRGGLVAAAVVLVALAAGGAYVVLGGKDDAAIVPPPQALPSAPATVTAPTQVTATSAATTATDAATAAASGTTAAAATTVATEPPAAAAPAAAPETAKEPQQAPEPPPAPAAPTEEFWVVAGPFQSEDAAAGVKTYAPDLTIRQDVRNVKLSAQVVRSEAPTSEADARNLADQLAAYGLAAALEADGDGFRLSVGPLASPSAAEQAATLLLSLGHPARASRVQVDSAVVYVDVGPLPTEEEASALSRTIQDRLSVRTGLKREAAAP